MAKCCARSPLKCDNSLISRYHHLDHSGDTSTFPKHTKILVGPGFRDAFLPGFPAKEGSPFPESAFEGRDVVEVPFSQDVLVGKYQAHDYFGDGSLYVLNVPGHAVGHIAALVRTTKDSFVFMGGKISSMM